MLYRNVLVSAKRAGPCCLNRILLSIHYLVENCGRLYIPKMTVLIHFPLHMLFFQYDMDTCPLRGRHLHTLPLNSGNPSVAFEIIQLCLVGPFTGCWTLEPSHHATGMPKLAHEERPHKVTHVDRTWGSQLTQQASVTRQVSGWAIGWFLSPAFVYVMEQRQVAPALPCPNSRPRESVSRINDHFMPQKF